MNIALRVDASVQMGSGHVMRCLTLADQLRENGDELYFVCRELPGNLCDYLENKGFMVYRLAYKDNKVMDWGKDAIQTEEILKKNKKLDWLIIDHYGIDHHWESHMRKWTHKILVIDDLANRRHDCDLLLDQNLRDDLDRLYSALIPRHSRKLLGPQFALLKKEFIYYRNARHKLNATDDYRILVSFGGSDPTNQTMNVLQGLKLLDSNGMSLTFDVIVGNANPNKEQIQQICHEMGNAQYYCQVEDMARFMSNAQLSIGGGGITTWERCCVGLPSIVITIAENQEFPTVSAAKQNALVYLGRFSEVNIKQIKHAVQNLIQDKEKCFALSEAGMKLVDGLGVQRVAECLDLAD